MKINNNNNNDDNNKNKNNNRRHGAHTLYALKLRGIVVHLQQPLCGSVTTRYLLSGHRVEAKFQWRKLGVDQLCELRLLDGTILRIPIVVTSGERTIDLHRMSDMAVRKFTRL